MSRIVVTTMGSLGDLHPQIAIALELRQRGHDIVFVTHQTYQAKIAALGFEFHRLRPDLPRTDELQILAQMMDLKTGSEYIIRKWVLPNLRDTYDDLMASAKDADFIVSGELVYVAPMVAEKLGIRWATSTLAPAAFFSSYDPSVLPLLPFADRLTKLGVTFNRAIKQIIIAVTKSWGKPIHQLRNELGLPPINGNVLVENRCSPDLVLALFSSVLAQPQPDWPQNTIVTGFTFYDGDRDRYMVELAPELQRFLKTGEAPIVFTLGTAAVNVPGNFYPESIRAARELNRRAVLLIGDNPLPKDLTPDIIAIDYAPYSQIFPYASAIVHQGGIGTTAQALRSGRPTIVTPYANDQPDNAARIERLGTSRTIARSQYTGARVARELRALLENPQYATRAAAVGRILHTENGVKTACDAIIQRIGSANE
ncbi:MULTISPECIES: glycosyltransferase [unclassified Chamaesiphon]|uniref:glycosyltransferase n=1 Tax=unclassified Chamaesiphon TaxID=2620921 RepID=UPI00286B12A4|nr:MULTISPECIES: glycosyltransferase [unclassified Chamaesiphon]